MKFLWVMFGLFTLSFPALAHEKPSKPRLALTKIFEQKNVERLLAVHSNPLSFGPENAYFTFGSEVFKTPLDEFEQAQENASIIRRNRRADFIEYQDGLLLLIDEESEPGVDPWEGYLHISENDGETFTPIDLDLSECVVSVGTKFCSPIARGTIAKKIGPAIYYNAGNYPNLMVTTKSKRWGQSWTPILGSLSNSMAMANTFAIKGNMLYVTADVNDTGVLKRHRLSDSKLALANPNDQEGEDLIDDLGYSQGYVYATRPGSNQIFVGMEEGLVRSDNQGNDWRFAARLDTFIQHIIFLRDKRMLVAGNLKVGAPYLGLSIDPTSEKLDLIDLTENLAAAIKKVDPGVDFEKVQIRGLKVGPNNKIYVTYVIVEEEGSSFGVYKGTGVLAEVKMW